MKRILLIGTVLIAFACGKDKFTTVPQVEIKSIAPDDVQQGNILQLRGEFRDQEGDIDSIFVVYKWYDGAIIRLDDTLKKSFDVFELPNNTREGDIVVAYAYGQQIDGYALLPGSPVAKDTTATLGLMLKDKKGNVSNYAESAPIRLRKS
jgi:hypothetical protein